MTIDDMTTSIKILEVEACLYHRYSGQTAEQPVYVELNCETGQLSADWNAEIGNAVPIAVWHGRTQRWSIPALVKTAANALLEAIAPLAQRVCDGYESQWDGSNHVGRYTDDARSAIDEIAYLCQASAEDAVNVIDPLEWIANTPGLDIRAGMTDAEIEAMAAELQRGFDDAAPHAEAWVLDGDFEAAIRSRIDEQRN